MSDPSDDALADLLGRIADEFTEALHRGDRPDVEDYARQHPEIASVLREVLPALQVMRLPASGGFAPLTPALPDCLGDYRLLREIGRGGMGIVYEAEQISLKRRVALKVLPVHPALQAKYLARFEREAKTAAQLHHTNIVPVYAVGCEQGTHFYAMQLIEGRSLDHILNDMRGRVTSAAALTQVQEVQACQLPEPLRSTTAGAASRAAPAAWFLAVARIGLQVAEVLEYAHQRGVIHRDIKPSNLILDGAGIVWISDFGLVKCLDSSDADNLTNTGDLLGTARYMSPEQALPKRGPADARSDIYGLGVTLYELLTLQPAFDGADQATLLRQIADDEPPAPRHRQREVPRDLETIVLRAMAKDPRQRYRSAAALAADLRRFLAGEPIRARSQSIVERAWKWTKRRPALAAFLAVSVLAALTLTAGAVWSNAELRDANERERQRAHEAEERERIGRHYLYAARMNLVQQAWERSYVARMRTLLDSERPAPGREDLRGFEWHYFWRLSHRERRSWPAHEHVITALAFRPDGLCLASGSSDKTVKLWDPATSTLLATLTGHQDGVTAVAFTPSGKDIASAGLDWTVRLWDTATRRERVALRGHHGAVLALTFSRDSRRLASGDANGIVHVWDAESGKALAVFADHTAAVRCLAFLPDGLLLSGGDDRTVRVWSMEECRLLTTLTAHAAGIRAIAVSPDGKMFLTGSADQTAKLWDTATHKERLTLRGHMDGVGAVAFTPDGQTVVTASGDPTPMIPTRDTRPRTPPVRARPGEVKLWDVHTGQERASLRGHVAPLLALASSPDGQTLASAGEDMSLILWDISGQEQATLPGHHPIREVNAVAFSPDGRTLASVSDDRTARVWNTATGRQLRVFEQHKGPVKTVTFSPDGRLLASGGGDNTVRVWDPTTGEERTAFKGHKMTVRAVVFAPDGRTLATASGDISAKPRPGEVKLWDVATWKERASLTGHADTVRSVAFSPDGAVLATGSDDRTVRLWDGATGRHRATLGPFSAVVRSVAFAPDGRTLAIACGSIQHSHEPGEVVLWDMTTGRERARLQGHRAAILAVLFAPDGRTLATGSTDGTVKLWDPVTAQERAVLEGHHGLVRALAFAPDGRVLATGDSAGMVKLWFAARQD